MKKGRLKQLGAVLALSLAVAAVAPAAGAQQADDYSAYSDEAREQAMLYRGRRATSYSNVHFNGTYYWQHPDFQQGSVCYNGKVYKDVLLNVDACEQELHVRYSSAMPVVVVSRDYVTWFTMGGSRYINGDISGIAGATGYYKVLGDKGTMVLQQVRKSIKKSTDNVNGDTIGYKDPTYNPNIHSYFAMESRWYVVKDGHLKKVSRHKATKTLANEK